MRWLRIADENWKRRKFIGSAGTRMDCDNGGWRHLSRHRTERLADLRICTSLAPVRFGNKRSHPTLLFAARLNAFPILTFNPLRRHGAVRCRIEKPEPTKSQFK